MTSITYKKLWYRLIDDNISKTELRRATGISSSTLANMKNGKKVSLEVLLKIWAFLHCTMDEITEIRYDEHSDCKSSSNVTDSLSIAPNKETGE